jgi:hypothetical protein
MKKIYLFIAAAFCAASTNAQTLTQANHAPIVGDSYQTVDCSTVGVNPGGNGTSQTWNFSTVSVLSTTVTMNGVTVASTGSAAIYPSASMALSPGTGTNSFYSSSASLLSYWGGNATMGGQQVTLTYTSPATYCSYPFNYLSTTNATTGGSCTTVAGPGTFNGSSTVTATGTGMIMLPGGYNFSNILKVATSQYILATLSIGQATLSQNKYDYYSPLSKFPLFSITNSTLGTAFGTTTETLVAINNNYKTVGITEQTNIPLSNVSVYPNPAKDNISISFNNENSEPVSYQLVNVLGQTIRQQSIPSAKGETLYNVNLNGIESGIYFVKLSVGNKTSVTKITVQ